MALIPEIDEAASRENARRELKQYKTLARMAHKALVDIKSPTVSDMPKAPANGNGVEIRLTDCISDRADAEAELNRIDTAMSYLPARSYWLLYFAYCSSEDLSLWQIAERIGVEDAKTVSYLKGIALLQFAEAYSDKLLVFKQ